MSCLKKRFHSEDQLPRIYFTYYGMVAFHTEPLQSCVEMFGQGFNAGMSIGESGTAFLNALWQVRALFFAGEKLSALLEKIDIYVELAKQHKNDVTMINIYRDTISTLIDKGESTSAAATISTHDKLFDSEVNFFHKAIQSYWLGHNDRCQHYIGKMKEVTESPNTGRLNITILTFIHGLNTFQLLKKQNTSKLRTIPRAAISALKTLTSNSEWNFRNKVHLLEAESSSFNGRHQEAAASYAAAIASARSSRFIHEEGLACELAGFHHKKIGDLNSAYNFFNQAKRCYTEWGSRVKVESVTRQLERITPPALTT